MNDNYSCVNKHVHHVDLRGDDMAACDWLIMIIV